MDHERDMASSTPPEICVPKCPRCLGTGVTAKKLCEECGGSGTRATDEHGIPWHPPEKDPISDVMSYEPASTPEVLETQISPAEPDGLTIEHILLSVTVVSGKDSAGQFDDSAAFLVGRELLTYHGVQCVDAKVQYDHTKIEKHLVGCECHWCELAARTVAMGRNQP